MGGREELDHETKKAEKEDLEQEEEEEGEAGGRLASKIWDCGSPLYDSYELVSIGHVLDKHVMALPHLSGSRESSISSTSSSSLPSSSMGSSHSRKVIRCSFMPSFKVWKRKMDEDDNEKPKNKKVRFGVAEIFLRIGSWKK